MRDTEVKLEKMPKVIIIALDDLSFAWPTFHCPLPYGVPNELGLLPPMSYVFKNRHTKQGFSVTLYYGIGLAMESGLVACIVLRDSSWRWPEEWVDFTRMLILDFATPQALTKHEADKQDVSEEDGLLKCNVCSI